MEQVKTLAFALKLHISVVFRNGLFTRSNMSKAIISSTPLKNSLILKRIKKKTFKSMKCSALFLIMLQLEYEYFYKILSWISAEQNGLFVLFLTYCKYFNVFLLIMVLAFRRRIYVYIRYYIIMKLLITLLLGIFMKSGCLILSNAFPHLWKWNQLVHAVKLVIL